MKLFVLASVLTACQCAVSSLGTAVASDGSLISKRSVGSTQCCPCGSYGRCDDSRRCTPYCGRGDCNIFGCNCDDGCRRAGTFDILSNQQSLESKESHLEADESSDIFDISDANKDGVITIDEWLDSPVRSTSDGETCSMLVKHWARFDLENIGYITKYQAINRKA